MLELVLGLLLEELEHAASTAASRAAAIPRHSVLIDLSRNLTAFTYS
jgi:hypothetical protein